MTRRSAILPVLALLLAPLTACAQVTVEFTFDGMYNGAANDTPPAISDNVVLSFLVDPTGAVSLDAQADSDDTAVIDLINQWDRPSGAAGQVTDPAMWGQLFFLEIDPDGGVNGGTSVDEIGVRTVGDGHIGVAGANPGRIDNNGDESLQFELELNAPAAGILSRFTLLDFTYVNGPAEGTQLEVSATRDLLEPADVTNTLDLTSAAETVAVSALGYELKSSGSVLDPEVFAFTSVVDAAGGVGLAGFTFDFFDDTTADLDFDGELTANDISLFIAGWRADTSDLSYDEQIGAGDLNHDGVTDYDDWAIMRDQFALAGSPLAEITSLPTPEPTALALLAVGVLAAGGRQTRQK